MFKDDYRIIQKSRKYKIILCVLIDWVSELGFKIYSSWSQI